ncbi:RDD family protein [Paenibacillus antarcticus]|nr:cytochrome c oxidase assembly factor Coa1 family protein [Paenibacillus antarcticus]
MKRASIISRIVASLIDIYLIVFITMMLIFLLLNWTENNLVLSMIISLVFILLGVTSVLFKDVFDGRSLGKRIFNLGVRELDSTIPSTKKLINRNLSFLFWPKDVYKLIFSEDKRRQGDINNRTDVYQLENTNSMSSKVLKILISISIIVVLIISGFITIIKQDASYKTALTYIENNERIQEKVGDNMNFSFFPSASINRSNGYGEATFNIKVTGDKDSLLVFIMLVKVPNEEWIVENINYKQQTQ